MVSFKQLTVVFIVFIFCGIVKAKQVVNIPDNNVKVYKRPHTRSKLIQVLREGDKILILNRRSKKFYRVQLKNGEKGYIPKESLTLGRQNKKKKNNGKKHAFSISFLGLFNYQGKKEVATPSGSKYEVEPSTSLTYYPEAGYYYLANPIKWKAGVLYKTFKFEQTARNSDSGGALGETISQVQQAFIGGQLSVGFKSQNFLWLIGGEALKAISSNINTIKGVAIEEDSTMPIFVGGLLQSEYYMTEHFQILFKMGAIFNTNPFIYNVDFGLGYRF